MAQEETKIVDLTKRVKVKCTKDAPHHEEGEIVEVAPAIADYMVKNKWAVKV